MQALERLTALCESALKEKGLDADDRYKKRLEAELRETSAQDAIEYFLTIHDQKIRYPYNQHNLLVPYLLDAVTDFDVNRDSDYLYGDWCDADLDYLAPIRDYLKNEWAPNFYGPRHVCNIGSYNTFGIKNSLQYMARVFGKPRAEVLAITKTLKAKDDDGKVLTWDKALDLYPEVKDYCERNPEVADAAKRLLGRCNSMGKHAGGLIISSVPIDEFVPLVQDKDGLPASAWVEGLSGQDLGPVGLIKFDLLVVTNLMQIAKTCRLIKKRHGLANVCALPGQYDWSDTSYLEDEKALKMADAGDLKCIFQFDSPGIRHLVKSGGVTRFDDLVAYTSLYRPGPMQTKMHERYVERKRGRESYTIHDILKPYLSNTYGVLCYQEQIMQVLNVAGEIPLKDCEMVRKAISKKKEEVIKRYKGAFIKNGQKNLGLSEEAMAEIFSQIEAFAGYAFNKAHGVCYTVISMRLLWLKSHYPLEFYAAILSCETDSDKIKEYKRDAKIHQIPVSPVDINRSGVTTEDLVGDDIYFGLSAVKGIGDEAAARVVANRPYTGIRSFLERFGDDGAVLKPLIGLRVFKEADPVTLYRYCLWYRKMRTKREQRDKRFEKTRLKVLGEVKAAVPESFWDGVPVDECGDAFLNFLKEKATESTKKIIDKYVRCVQLYRAKVKSDKEIPDVHEFNPEQARLNAKAEAKMAPLLKTLADEEDSQMQFYGFQWTHTVERSPDYEGNMTFEDHRAVEGKHVSPVEVKVLNVEKVKSKKGTVYWLLTLGDANGEIQKAQVWSDDWDRFANDIREGALLRLRLASPDPGFGRYTLQSWPRWERWKHLPKTRENDFRVTVMRPPVERKVS